MNLRLTKIPPNVDLLIWFQLLATNHDDRTLVYDTPQPADFLPAQ